MHERFSPPRRYGGIFRKYTIFGQSRDQETTKIWSKSAQLPYLPPKVASYHILSSHDKDPTAQQKTAGMFCGFKANLCNGLEHVLCIIQYAIIPMYKRVKV